MELTLFAIVGANCPMPLGARVAYWICYGFYALVKLIQASNDD